MRRLSLLTLLAILFSSITEMGRAHNAPPALQNSVRSSSETVTAATTPHSSVTSAPESAPWTRLGPFRDIGDGIAVSPGYAQDRTIFLLDRPLGSFGVNLAKSTDGGQSWRTVDAANTIGSLSGSGARIRISPNYASDQTLFAEYTNHDMTLKKSQDGGLTWTTAYSTTSGTWAKTITDFAISPNFDRDHTLILYGGLLSKDGGNTWQQSETRWPGGDKCRVYFSPNYAIDDSLFVMCSTFERSTLSKSTDLGANWTTVGIVDGWVESTAFSPTFSTDSTIVARSSKSGFVRSTDGGQTWTDINVGVISSNTTTGVSFGADLIAISPDFSTDRTIYGVSLSGHANKSTDGGNSWVPISSFTVGYFVAISPSFGTDHTVFLAGPGGAVKSSDGGTSWQAASPGYQPRATEEIKVSPAFAADQTLFTINTGGFREDDTLFSSNDGGKTWLMKSMTTNISALSFSPNFATDHTMFMGTQWSDMYRVGRIFKSTDRGVTWNDAYNGLPTNPSAPTANVHSFAVSPNYANDNTIFAGTSLGVYKSINGASDWGISLSSSGSVGSISEVVMSPQFATDNTVFAGTWNGVYKSANRGDTWQPVNQGLTYLYNGEAHTYTIEALAISPNYSVDHTLFAGTDTGGIYKTMDGGVSWSKASNGLPAEFPVKSLALSPTYVMDKTIYVAAYTAGVFRSTDRGQSWLAINDNVGNVNAYAAYDIAVTSNPSRIFLAANAGVWRRDADAVVPQPDPPPTTTNTPTPSLSPTPMPTASPTPMDKIDTDGDGLWDEWEEKGYNGVNLPKLGANKNRRDIFVYVDWLGNRLHNHHPHTLLLEDPLDEVVQAFAEQGIALHITYGRQIEETDVNRELGSSPVVDGKCNYYDPTEFNQLKSENFPSNMQPIFHYAIFGHYLPPVSCNKNQRPVGVSPNTNGRVGGSDFIVAMGGWDEYFSFNNIPLWSRGKARAGVFMHELGHNLGLDHGGLDDLTYKPNHLSVMNYSFMTRGLRKSGFGGNVLPGKLDYSRFDETDLPTLNEADMSEPEGLRSNRDRKELDSLGSRYYCNNGIVLEINNLRNPVNWDCGFPPWDTSNQHARMSINNDKILDKLTTVNEWKYLVFNGGSIGKPSPGIHAASSMQQDTSTLIEVHPELTLEEDITIAPYGQFKVYLPATVR